ncbi:glycosyl transferase family 90 [Vibrio agarivorans]|uniref:glycosyl transferase family 90 n=1 Tax=Vibrio agarivorans TaxID=153622 RepID=UPI0025B29098|nr:glycosyl transferase family 90 [Vibrio agarivorans]MDN3662170.1 glycosyl transferase family 90 [Vibrio agarivorans]
MFKFYVRKLAWLCIPRFILQRYRTHLEKKWHNQHEYIQTRINYYCALKQGFSLDAKATTYNSYQRKGNTAYFLDLKEYLRYFPRTFRFLYHFGDETHVNDKPTLFKARPQRSENENSVLFKLDTPRHFRFVNDTTSFRDKKNMAIFRGAVHGEQSHRVSFMRKMFDHPLMDAGQPNFSDSEYFETRWQKPYMDVNEQLQYKFLVCLEGNDVASNLKWAMSSNSVVITPKMKFETWFMEGKLEAGVHYIEVKDDWSDFDEKMAYYLANPEKAEAIIKNAHAHVAPFLNSELERLVCIKTLERYFELSSQVI